MDSALVTRRSAERRCGGGGGGCTVDEKLSHKLHQLPRDARGPNQSSSLSAGLFICENSAHSEDRKVMVPLSPDPFLCKLEKQGAGVQG